MNFLVDLTPLECVKHCKVAKLNFSHIFKMSLFGVHRYIWCLGCTAFASLICRPLFVYRSPLSNNKLFLILRIQCNKYTYNDKFLLQLELFPQFTTQIRRPRQSCQADCLLELHLKNIPIMQNRLAFPLTKYPSAQPFSQSYKGSPLKHTNLSRFWNFANTIFKVHIPAFSYSPVYCIARTTIETIMSHIAGHQIATSNSLWHSNWSTDGFDPMRLMEEELPPLN